MQGWIVQQLAVAWLGIAGRNDSGGFDHQDDRPLRGARAMNDTLGHDKALLRSQLDCAVFEIDDKAALKDKKELVVMVVLVPVVSPCITPRRTTESFTWQRVWLYHLSLQAFTREGTSTKSSAGNLTSKCVA